jgi:protease-4
MEGLFFRGTFDKLGLAPRMDHRYEYKNAMNQYTERSFTPPHREALTRVKDSWFSQMVRGIAQGRRLSEEQVRGIVDKGPYLGAEAKAAGLVDGMAYRDEVIRRVKGKAGKDAKLLYLGRYRAHAGGIHEKGKRIALIYGIGGVERGRSGYDPLSDSQSMGSETVAGAFRAAVEDKDVKAILFRVDSPGGSYVASDTIWREVVRAREAGKPVVVSMGTLAGSGGYFVAMAADKIVAQPGTITGSIGVLGGKVLTKGLWDKVGLTFDEVHSGQNANMFDSYRDFSKEEWARFQAWLDRVYDDFTSKVAEGRRLPKERVLEIAKGRIWTGEDAKARGLVDELGGFPTALRLTKQAAKIPEGDEVELKVFPPKKTTVQTIMEMLGGGDERESSEPPAAGAFTALRPLLGQLRALGLYGKPPGILAMPDTVAVH